MRKRDPDKSKNYRYQQYRPAWEKEGWAEGWLTRSTIDPGKAFCNVCQKQLVPGKSELQSHSKSAIHTRRVCSDQKSFCKSESPSGVCSKEKDSFVVITSNLHSDHELYKFKPDLSSRFASQAQPTVVTDDGMELAGPTDSPVNDILQEAQSVSDIGFAEDLWDNSMQVETAMAVEGLASLSRNEVPVHPNPSSSSQPTQIVILAQSSVASNSDDIISSTVVDMPQTMAVSKSEVFFCNKKPIISSSHFDNVPSVPTPLTTSANSSFMHNYSCAISPLQQQGKPPVMEQKVPGVRLDCSKCKIHDIQWRDYFAEKIKLKRLEQQRVREELKSQKLIQQYYRLKIRQLPVEEHLKGVQ